MIGAAEPALITDHPIGRAFDRDFQKAINDPEVFGFVWLLLVRTRFIDEVMERAIGGATERQEAALKAMDDAARQQAAGAARTSGRWPAELTVAGNSVSRKPGAGS